jgi:hypothetical protein
MAIDDQATPRGRPSAVVALTVGLVVLGILILGAIVMAAIYGGPNWRALPFVFGREVDTRPLPANIPGLAANPAAFAGQQVSIPGTVQLVLGPRGFLLTHPQYPGVEIVVVSPRRLNQLVPNPSLLLEGNQVRVTGTVREFHFLPIEQELGVDLPDALYARYVGRPAIIATEIAPG